MELVTLSRPLTFYWSFALMVSVSSVFVFVLAGGNVHFFRDSCIYRGSDTILQQSYPVSQTWFELYHK